MLVGWTMSFPQPYLKDRVLLPADKTFHLATRAQGSQLSGGFPTRPCGQAFQPFFSSSIYNAVFLLLPLSYPFFIAVCRCLSLTPLQGVFELWVTATQKYVYIYQYVLEAFTSCSIYFLPLSSARCGQKTKSTKALLYSLMIGQVQLADNMGTIRPETFSQ